jgi:hypothetical protein
MDEWEKLKDSLEIYVPAWLPDDTKQKVVDQTKDKYKELNIYDYQMRASSFCRQIEVSRLLGMNDVVVPVLIHEYAELHYCLRAVQHFMVQMKNTPAPINKVLDGIQLKSLSGWLYKDLQFLIKHHNVIIDLTSCLASFKALTVIETDFMVKAAKHKDFGANGFLRSPIIKNEIERSLKLYGNKTV